MTSYITENTDAVRREFEDIIKTGWLDRGIQSLGTTLSAFYLWTSGQYGNAERRSDGRQIHEVHDDDTDPALFHDCCFIVDGAC